MKAITTRFSCIATVALLLLAATAAAGRMTPETLLRLKALDAAIADRTVRGAPATVAALNVTQYLGRWYECFQDWTTANTFQQQSYCATADYFEDPDNSARILVSNREHYGSVDGGEKNVSGYAYRADAAAYPGRLTVVLHGDHASPFPAPYWVLRLGPIVAGKYDWAVVSDDLRATLFVLARDPARFHSSGDAADVLAWLSQNGFTEPWNRPVALPQGANCTYFPPQPPAPVL